MKAHKKSDNKKKNKNWTSSRHDNEQHEYKNENENEKLIQINQNQWKFDVYCVFQCESWFGSLDSCVYCVRLGICEKVINL